MTLSSLRLVHFRSYDDESFEFDDKVNIIVGPNAIGKTNLLEAVLVMARGGSYRVSDKDLIKHKESWLRIEAQLSDGKERVVKIKNDQDIATKIFHVDGKDYKRLPARLKLPIVLFEPNHLLLLHGQPEARRNYLDDLVESVSPEFGITRRHYKRVLAQRNSLLKQPTKNLEQQVFVWDVRLSELGGYIATQRIKLVEELNKQMSALYSDIAAQKTKVHINYGSNIPLATYESSLLRQLNTSLERDVERGFTSYGPHRDDFSLYINDELASETASRGETRTALLALKIFELEQVEAQGLPSPMLLLDDVFSELDGRRRKALTTHINKYQTFITTTDADLIGKDFSQRAHIILSS